MQKNQVFCLKVKADVDLSRVVETRRSLSDLLRKTEKLIFVGEDAMAKYRLGDIAPVKQGTVPDNNQYWLLNLDAVESNTGTILEYVYVDYSQIGASTVSFDQKNVLYSKLRPYLNKVVLPDRAGYATSEMLPLRPDEEIITREYLTFFLRSSHFVEYINGKTIGAKMPRANTADLKAVEIECPPIVEQIRIVSQINSVLTIIAYRKKVLSRLDDLIKARFVEMFGDPEINPKGWEQVTLNDVCSSIIRGPFGSALKKEFFVEPGESTYKVYEQKHAIQKSATIGTYYVTAEKYSELKRFECKAGDILMSCSGTMGELYQLPEGCERGIINQALCKFTLNEKILPICFLTYMQQTIGNIETKGSGIQNIAAVSYVKAMPINLPPMDVQEQFATFVAQVDKSKVAVQAALDKAQLLFDSLMQQYFG